MFFVLFFVLFFFFLGGGGGWGGVKEDMLVKLWILRKLQKIQIQDFFIFPFL